MVTCGAVNVTAIQTMLHLSACLLVPTAFFRRLRWFWLVYPVRVRDVGVRLQGRRKSVNDPGCRLSIGDLSSRGVRQLLFPFCLQQAFTAYRGAACRWTIVLVMTLCAYHRYLLHSLIRLYVSLGNRFKELSTEIPAFAALPRFFDVM